VDTLSKSAKKRALLNVAIDRTTLVASDTLLSFVTHYAQAIPGKTYICYGVSGCGKTVAAVHLLHGSADTTNTNNPKLAIMVNAGGSDDFPTDFSTDFSRQQNAPNAAPLLVNILCASLERSWRHSKHLGNDPSVPSIRGRFLRGTCRYRRTKYALAPRHWSIIDTSPHRS
jgi:hypothetical protein